MFPSKKNLIIHNQRRAKRHVKLIQKELLKEVEDIINNETLPLEHQEAESTGVLKMALKKVLSENLKIWSNE